MDDLVQPSQSSLRRVMIHSFVLQFSYASYIEHRRLITVDFIGLRRNASEPAVSVQVGSVVGELVLAHQSFFATQAVLQDDRHRH